MIVIDNNQPTGQDHYQIITELSSNMKQCNCNLSHFTRENQILCVAPLSYKFSGLLTFQIDTYYSHRLPHTQCLALNLNFLLKQETLLGSKSC